MATSIIKADSVVETKSSRYFELTKRGGIVQLKCSTNLPSTSDGVALDNIPVGFRPSITTDYLVFSTSGGLLGMLRFNTNGSVTPVFGAYTSGTSRFFVTYVCA